MFVIWWRRAKKPVFNLFYLLLLSLLSLLWHFFVNCVRICRWLLSRKKCTFLSSRLLFKLEKCHAPEPERSAKLRNEPVYEIGVKKSDFIYISPDRFSRRYHHHACDKSLSIWNTLTNSSSRLKSVFPIRSQRRCARNRSNMRSKSIDSLPTHTSTDRHIQETHWRPWNVPGALCLAQRIHRKETNCARLWSKTVFVRRKKAQKFTSNIWTGILSQCSTCRIGPWLANKHITH